jgi:outer membrane immunogenic protein
MKNWMMGIASVALLAAGPAMAADMPAPAYKAPPVVAAWTWAGFYVGGHGGYGWKENSFVNTLITAPLVTIGGISSEGWVAGAQAGHNWQFGRWVVGLEIDGSATGINGTAGPVNFIGFGGTNSTTVGDDVKMLGTARARVGYAVTSGCCWNAMIYGTGGLAWERLTRTTILSNTFAGVTTVNFVAFPRNIFGWVAGAGIEMQLGNTNWIARAEYLHYDFGDVEGSFATFTPGAPAEIDSGGTQRIDMVRAALSYKFTPGSSY